MTLKNRIAKLEASRQNREGLQPYTVESEDGRVSAKIWRHKGKVGGTVWYDSLSLDPETAVGAIAPLLSPECNVLVVPEVLSPQEWTRHYSRKINDEPPMPTLH
jgi:hypothetical protein